MEITTTKLQEFFQAIDFSFRAARMETPTFWANVAKLVPSSTEQNVYPWIAEIPGLREWLGARVVNNLATRDYTLKNKDYEDTIGIDRNKVEDDQVGLFGDIAAALGRRVEEFPDEQVAATIEAGTTELAWDGQFFFDTDHPVNIDDTTLGTFSNLLTGAGFDLAADPGTAFANARRDMMKFKRDDGKPLGIVGNVLMVPPDLEREGRIAVEAQFQNQITQNVAGAENVAASAPTNVYQGFATLIVNPWLTEATSWYLFNTTRGIMPFLYQLRQAAQLVPRVDPMSDNIFHLRRFEWGVHKRCAFGYTFPFLAAKMTP